MSRFRPIAVCPHCRRPVKALPLSYRMMQVLKGLLAEKNCKEIAYDLRVGIKTVEFHRAKLYEAAGVDNLVGLVRWALEQGFEFEERGNDT